MKKVTIEDIAKEANVSISTVSRVSNNSPQVNERTYKKVMEVIQKKSYVPTTAAHLLARKRKNTMIKRGCIGVLMSDALEQGLNNEFWSGMYNSILKETVGYSIKLFTDVIRDNYRGHSDLPDIVKDEVIDGAIILGTVNEQALMDISKTKIPLVTIENPCLEQELNSINIDDFQAGYLATKYLLDCGHRKIGLLRYEIMDEPLIQQRFLGFKTALSKYNIPYEERYTETSRFTYKTGYEGMKRMLQKGDLPTAIFAMNDISALGAKAAIENSGLRVPEDISLIGVDNIPMSSEVIPGLTTIDVEREEIGKMAVQKLLDINDVSAPKQKIVKSVKLVERGSVKRLNQDFSTEN